jgi:CBS domain-containing protein
METRNPLEVKAAPLARGGPRRRPTTVREAMRASFVPAEEDASLPDLIVAMDRNDVDELPVVAGTGTLRGMVERRAVERRLLTAAEAPVTAAALVEPPIARATPGESIEDAVDDMLANDASVLPVVSPDGRLEGLLVLEDVKQTPRLVQTVSENRRLKAAVAATAEVRLATVTSIASAFLGVALFGLWVQGPPNGLDPRLAWTDAVVATLAFVGAATASSRDLISVPVWAAGGIGLFFVGLLAHGFHGGGLAISIQFVLGAALLLLAVVAGSRTGRRIVAVGAKGLGGRVA